MTTGLSRRAFLYTADSGAPADKMTAWRAALITGTGSF
jgi:hypothetical protein